MDIQTYENAHDRDEQESAFRLAQPVEFVTGLNNIPMLYIPERQRYIRLSAPGKAILEAFQAGDLQTKQDALAFIAARYPQKKEDVSQKVEAFLAQLEGLGILTPARETTLAVPQKSQAGTLSRFFHRVSNDPMLRVTLWRPNRILADTLLNRIRANEIPQMAKVLLWFWLSLAALLTGYSLFRLGIFFDAEIVNWPLVILFLACHLAGHEFSHLIVGSYHRVKTRTIGFGLLYYILPVFYVDRTDSYRLRNSSAYASIALAGPAFDISLATASAMLMTFMAGWLKASLHVLFLLEAVIFISNINPLMPGDGYQALESILGGMNFRRRAFQTLFCFLTRTKLPPQLKNQSRRINLLSCCYCLLAFAWIAFMFYVVITFVRGEVH